MRHVLWLALISAALSSCFPPALPPKDTGGDGEIEDTDVDPTEVTCTGGCDSLTGPCSVGQCVAGQCVAVPVGDGVSCETNDLCADGRCLGLVCSRTPKDCSDSLSCSIDSCDPATGACLHDLGTCSCTTDQDCDNGDPCDGDETCQPGGTCASGAPVLCNPGPEPCKPVVCDKTDGQCRAVIADDGATCDDGDLCTEHSVCADGTCEGVARRCEPSGPCETEGLCDARTGACTPIFLADGEPCDSDGDAGFCRSHQCVPRQVLAGGAHTCVLDGHQLSCWGNGFLGQLGLGSIVKVGDDEHPADYGLLSFTEGLKGLSLGANSTCVVLGDSRVRCWGEGANYQHGYGHNGDVGVTQSAPQLPNLPIPLIHSVAVGFNHTCALMSGSKAPRCWGRNANGQLGTGTSSTVGSAGEGVDAAFPRPFVRLRAGAGATCGIDDERRLWCWGQNNNGKLGLGHTRDIGDDEAPSSAGYVPLDGRAIDVGVGAGHACALLEDGRVRCWGWGPFLGLGRADDLGDDEAILSAPAVDLGGVAIGLGVGSFHTCALMEGGDVRCWGMNTAGQLGLGHTNAVGQQGSTAIVPVQLGGVARQIASGGSHNCALLEDGGIRCWGSGRDGRLGLANEENIGDDETPGSQPAVRWK